MVRSPDTVRHVVAWLSPVRWVTCLLLWVVVAVVWVLPQLDLLLRAIGPFGLTAAICRTRVALLVRRGHVVPF